MRFLGLWGAPQGSYDFPLPDGKTYLQAVPWADVPEGIATAFSLRGLVALGLCPNLTGQMSGYRWQLASGQVHKVLFPTWLFLWAKLDGLLPRLSMLRGIVPAYLRHTARPQYEPEDLLVTLAALTQYQREYSERYPGRWTQLFLYGYSLWTDAPQIIEDEILPRFSTLREIHIGAHQARERDRQRVRAVIEDLTWSTAKYEGIDMLRASPINLIVPISETLWWIDWSLLQEVVLDFVAPFGRMEGAIARLRGHEFEDVLGKHLRQAVDELGAAIWWVGRENGVLRFEHGRPRDLDIGVTVGNVLIVIDAKAHAIERDLLIVGQPKKLQDRFTEITTPDLDHVDTLADRLAAEPAGRNFVLPADVEYIIGIVCGTFPEWIASSEPKWWLYDDIPRVCTPEEVWEVLSRLQDGRLPTANLKTITSRK